MSILLAGPILRRLQANRITLWAATSQPVQWRITLTPHGQMLQVYTLGSECTTLAVAQSLYIHLINLPLQHELPANEWTGYDMAWRTEGGQWTSVQTEAPHLLYPGQSTLGFVYKPQLDVILHGSCRKPHFHRKDGTPSGDGLARADEFMAVCLPQPHTAPSVLLLSGDQIYTDDVAGPMLHAIHQLCAHVQPPAEPLPGTPVANSHSLHTNQANYYTRENLLPKAHTSKALRTVLFTGVKKPIFTSDNARNHLISLAEIFSMVVLCWSPMAWRSYGLQLSMPDDAVPARYREKYQHQLKAMQEFVGHLDAVHRVMAHVPVAMVFDDHDVTDDWNLSAQWEETAYGEPFSRRIIGNALVAYLTCQAWGNAPDQFPASLLGQVQESLHQPGSPAHDALITHLIAFRGWNYQWNTHPPLMVIDTRTNRWRSETNPANPSGLMDWESLTDLQHKLLNQRSVVLVSPAPMFGVKFIEAIQRVFTWAGKPLLVDAENWMAHQGAARTLVNMFCHMKTPQNFVVLSGDVHYSFAYDVEIRRGTQNPHIWQVVSSGMRNEFPGTLLNILDRLNRWLYAPWSPLNWFTKRRKLRVIPRKPDPSSKGERLVNGSGIGLLKLAKDGKPVLIAQLLNQGGQVTFHERAEDEAH